MGLVMIINNNSDGDDDDDDDGIESEKWSTLHMVFKGIAAKWESDYGLSVFKQTPFP